MRRPEFVLSDDERNRLIALSLERSRAAGRARIVLACAESGATYSRIARDAGVSAATVNSIRRRFAVEGIDGLLDRPRSGRPKTPLQLSDAERAELERWARRASSPQALALRCRIVLGCARGLDNKQVAEREGVSERTVAKWRSRFVEQRMKSLVIR